MQHAYLWLDYSIHAHTATQKCCLAYYYYYITTLHNSFSMATMHEGCRMWIDFFKENFRKILAKLYSHHLCNFWIDWFCEYASVGTYVFDELVQTWPFHFFAFYVRDWIIKIEQNAALLQLFDEDRTLLWGRCIWKAQETQVFKNQKSVKTKNNILNIHSTNTSSFDVYVQQHT